MKGFLKGKMPHVFKILKRMKQKVNRITRPVVTSIARLFEKEFGKGNVKVDTYGNVYAAVAFLQGLP